MISIVNYGVGNIKAFYNIYKKLGFSVKIAEKREDFDGSTKIILPGVGSFDWAMMKLNNSGMRQELDRLVLDKKIPVLGICVGMQMMAGSSDEGKLPGLGWIDAEVKRFSQADSESGLFLPHMGWQNVYPSKENLLFKNIKDNLFYFLHSYYFYPKNKDNILSTTNYHLEFASAIQEDNIYATQFHPEKSHQSGVMLLKNFAEL